MSSSDGVGGGHKDAVEFEISPFARLSHRVVVQDQARVIGKSFILNHARISGRAIVCYAAVYGMAQISDNAKVLDGSSVYGEARIYGHAQVGGGLARRRARVGGHMCIGGTAKILGGKWEGDFEINEGIWDSPDDWGANVLL